MRIFLYLLLFVFIFSASASAQLNKSERQFVGDIIIGTSASDLEHYAAKELQRYLYQLSGSLLEIKTDSKEVKKPSYIIGHIESNPVIKALLAENLIELSRSSPGAQGYILKRIELNKHPVIIIAGGDEVGCLYGVYGLLSDYYHIGFFLGGDILPEKKVALKWIDVNEKKTPSVYIRGFLPWTNFPQSATSYSWEDWKFILDQMAKMRLNFIHIHNYNGELGHNEMYHNFTYKGYISRVWMPTARHAHAWAMSPWDVNKYRFGATDLFDDYDFGADCALHNENLTNEEVFRKSASLFQKVIDYAHSRGVKVGLGLDIDLIPKEYNAKADEPGVVKARVDQLANDYPRLDYLLCFQSENVGKDTLFYGVWRKIFNGFYQGLRERMPNTRVAVAGWGLNPASIATLPSDVICAPISYYSDRCETGAIYGNREYWGCPWLERDFYSSEYYYPYNLHLSNTIAAFKERAPNMKGFYCLTWRLTDAVEPKMYYVARAPWDDTNELISSRTVYRNYAELAYGAAAADEITDIIDRNEPFACDYGECEGTPPFSRLEARGIFQLARFRAYADKGETAAEYSAASFVDQFGIGKNRCEEGGECIDWIDAGDWAQYREVDFGSGASNFEVRVASATEGGIIELKLDSANGLSIGTCIVRNTGGLQRWATVRCAIKPTSGKHTLHLNFLSRKEPFADRDKAIAQLRVIDKWIQAVQSPSQRARLKLLRCRIAAVKDHIELNEHFEKYSWSDLPGETESWAKNFTNRVTDISSLGNVMSMQNRYIQRNYVAKEDTLRSRQQVKAPANVTARGTRDGVMVGWSNEDSSVVRYKVYRDGKRINQKPLSGTTLSFVEKISGSFAYNVTAVSASGMESPFSVPSVCEAGSADKTAPSIVVVSPPTSGPVGQSVPIKARLLDNRIYDDISAILHYRMMGQKEWRVLAMERRIKAIFAVQIPAVDVTERGLEYFIEASDGDNAAFFPPSSPEMPLSITTYAAGATTKPPMPSGVRSKDLILLWESGAELPTSRVASKAFWYRIYRSEKPDFKANQSNFVTFVDAGTTKFKDNGEGFDGRKLKGDWFYRIAAVDKLGNESQASEPVRIIYAP